MACVCTVLFLGASAQIVFKTFPGLYSAVHAAENKRFYPKTNINKANEQALVKVPYIGAYTARRIIEHRTKYGHFIALDELKKIEGIRPKNFEKFSPYLTVK